MKRVFAAGMAGVMLAAVFLSAPAPGGAERAGEPHIWHAETVFRDTAKIDGVSIGDADPTLPGNEILAAGLSDAVTMIYKVGDSWQSKQLWKGQGELIPSTVGDVDPACTGNEVIVGGMKVGAEEGGSGGEATVLCRNADGSWTPTTVLSAGDLVHGIAVGDLDPSNPGNEILVASHDSRAYLIWKNATGWQNRTLFTDSDQLKNSAIGEFDTAHPGLEGVVVGGSGNVTEVYLDATGNWTIKTRWTAPGGLNRVAIGDILPENAGNEILTDGNYATVTAVYGSGSSAPWTAVPLWSDVAKMRGAAIGDVDPRSPGNEAVVAGFSANLTLLRKTASGWEAEQLFNDGIWRLHWAAIGDVDPAHDGVEVVTGGYSQNVTVVSYWEPDFSLSAPNPSSKISVGNTTTFAVNVTALGYFNSELTMAASGLPAGASARYSPPVLLPGANTTGTATVTVTLAQPIPNGNYPFTATLAGGGRSHALNLTLVVDWKFGIEVTLAQPVKSKYKSGEEVTVNVSVKNTGAAEDTFTLAPVSGLNLSWMPHMGNGTLRLKPGESGWAHLTAKMPASKEGKKETLIVRVNQGLNPAGAPQEVKASFDIEKKPAGCASIILLLAVPLVGCAGWVVRRRVAR